VATQSNAAERRSLGVAHDLEQAILEGRIRTGERLPSEGMLCGQFHASRTVIREAIQQLKARGLVRTIKGSGSYVLGGDVTDLQRSFNRYCVLANDPQVYSDLMEFRMLLEIECARRLAEHRDSRVATRLGLELERMRRHRNTPGLLAEADIAFHSTIVSVHPNGLLRALHESLRPLMLRFAARTLIRVEAIDGSIAEHEAIHTAILMGDGTRASREMRSHLDGARRRHARLFHEFCTAAQT
jgi:GntR family transcriptional repressor for pyruvate dehydrogenase complex